MFISISEFIISKKKAKLTFKALLMGYFLFYYPLSVLGFIFVLSLDVFERFVILVMRSVGFIESKGPVIYQMITLTIYLV